MGITALRHDSVIPDCLLALLKLLSRVEGPVLAEVVSVIAELLQKHRGTEDEEQTLRVLCRKFATMTDVSARAAILKIVGDMHSIHPTFGPLVLKFLAGNFDGLPGEVKLQALNLAARLVVIGTQSEIPLYFLRVCARDLEFDIRDRSRLLIGILTTPSESLQTKARQIFNPELKSAKWTEIEREKQFVIGSLSQFFGREVGGYEPLPDWAEESEIPPDSVRLPPKKLPIKKSRVESEEEDVLEEEDLDINEFFDHEKEKADKKEEIDEGEEEVTEEETDVEPEEDIDGFFE
jgi:AP-3 complex subunit beta